MGGGSDRGAGPRWKRGGAMRNFTDCCIIIILSDILSRSCCTLVYWITITGCVVSLEYERLFSIWTENTGAGELLRAPFLYPDGSREDIGKLPSSCCRLSHCFYVHTLTRSIRCSARVGNTSGVGIDGVPHCLSRTENPWQRAIEQCIAAAHARISLSGVSCTSRE